MNRVISVINQKGGVGKTTTVINLSAAIARLGHPVLVIDMDPQANVSQAIGLQHPHEALWTTSKLLLDVRDGEVPSSPWYDTVEQGISLIYGHLSLSTLERNLLGKAMPGLRLRSLLQKVALDEDHVILIDCPPSLSLLTVNALVASNSFIIPLDAGNRFALDGYRDLMEVVSEVREINEGLSVLGMLLNRFDGRKNIHKSMADNVRQRFGETVFKTVIPDAVKLQESTAAKNTIFKHERRSTSAQGFRDLGREVLNRLGLSAGEWREDAAA